MSETPNPLARGAHIADPGPLGLAAFALTTFVLSCLNAGFFKAEPAVFSLALLYGGATQFAAGMWEFVKGNTFGATAFASYGAFWMSFWYLNTHTQFVGSDGKTPIPTADIDHTVGLWLLAWGIFTLYMTVGASRVNAVLFALFAILTVTFFVLAFAKFGGSESLGKIGGYLGIAAAVGAWYASFAGVVKFTFGRDVLPLGAR